MLFSSAVFLFVFLPLTLTVYFLSPRRVKNHVLLLASLVFYLFGEVKYTYLLLLSALFNWGMGLAMSYTQDSKKRRMLLFVSVFANLALLFYYKYIGFFLGIFGFSVNAPALPIGISFYTFQAMSYTVDVYRGDATVEKNPLSFATYLCLFPQLIAGPIVRYTDVSAELKSRRHSLAAFADGAFLFVIGLAKKVIIADTLGGIAPLYRESAPSILFAWLYAIAFTLQIYFDFSGYSDMAVGLGRIFGFSFPKNFDYPYIAKSITEFWRRWHITLSSWFRSYVYIPLGGNRRGKVKLVRNILIVWLLTGLWHGSAFTFLTWGALYALLLLFEKFGGLTLLDKSPAFVGRLYTLFFVVLGFVIFNAESMGTAFGDIARLFSFGKIPFADARSLYYFKSYLPLLLLASLGATPLPRLFFSGALFRPKKKKRSDPSPLFLWGRAAAMTAILLTSIAFVVGESFRPFLYFRF